MLDLLPYWPRAADEASHKDRPVRWSPWASVPEQRHVMPSIISSSESSGPTCSAEECEQKGTYSSYLCFENATVEAVAFLVIVQAEFQWAQRGWKRCTSLITEIPWYFVLEYKFILMINWWTSMRIMQFLPFYPFFVKHGGTVASFLFSFIPF